MSREAPYYDEDSGDGAAYREGLGDPVFKKYLSILRRHLWPALTVMLVVSTLGLLRAYRATPIYDATAKIMVERQGPRVTKFEDVIQPNASWWGQEYYKTQEELVRSRAVLEIALEDPEIMEMFESRPAKSEQKPSMSTWLRRTVSAVLGAPPATPPEPWERLRGVVRARHAGDTHFILVQATTSDPKRTAKIANAVAAAYVRYHMLRRLEVSNDVFLYLEEQKQKEEEAVRTAETHLQNFREQTSISSLDSSDAEHPVMKRLSLLSDELTDTQLKRIEVESQGRVIRDALGKDTDKLGVTDNGLFSVPIIQEDPTINELRSSLVQADADRGMLADVYGPDHPRMQAVFSRIETLRGKLRSTLQNIAESLSTQEEMLRAEEAALKEQYDGQNLVALSLAKESLTYQRLLNELQRHQKLYQVLVERMSEVELSSDYTRTNVEIVEMAGLPKAPSAPNKPRMAMFAMFFGLLAGLGVAFFLEHADDTVRTPDDLETRVGVPVLGFVPEIRVRKNVESKSSYRALISALEPNSSTIEAYRNIRTSLFFAGPAEESRMLLVTSGGPSDGKTTTACNLALVIAQSGKRVLLIDADFRRPQVHRNFNLDNKTGLSNVLVGECPLEEAVQKTVHDINIIENLDILTAGPTPPNPTELLETSSMKKLVEDLRGKYDHVIIDTPPVLFVSDASILSSITDGVILVVRANRHTRAHAIRARKQLQKVQAHIIGGILNRVRVPRFGHHYSDFYYHGYARYRSDYYSAYYAGAKQTQPGTEKNVNR